MGGDIICKKTPRTLLQRMYSFREDYSNPECEPTQQEIINSNYIFKKLNCFYN
jgi:hypothetical protein